jgi:hypothetical protein
MVLRKLLLSVLAAVLVIATPSFAGAESKLQYKNRFTIMLDFAVRTNDYMRRHLGDRELCSYAQAMSQTNAEQAEQMVPPPKYEMMHPHFLLVLENVERSLYYASRGNLARYRQIQKLVRKEQHILEMMAEKLGIHLYYYRD